MKGIIVYKGKYGATKQYAEWIGKELNLPVLLAGDSAVKNLAGCDFVIIGSSVYIGKQQIRSWLKKNLVALRNKKIFFFQVAAAPPEEKEKVQSFFDASVPEELKSNCGIYFYPGKMVMEELSWTDKFMLRMGARMTKDPEAKKGMLTNFNHIEKENITGLVNAVKKLYATTAPPANLAEVFADSSSED